MAKTLKFLGQPITYQNGLYWALGNFYASLTKAMDGIAQANGYADHKDAFAKLKEVQDA